MFENFKNSIYPKLGQNLGQLDLDHRKTSNKYPKLYLSELILFLPDCNPALSTEKYRI